MIKDKLLRNMENISNEMREIYEIGTGSSISTSSYGDNNYIVDWI